MAYSPHRHSVQEIRVQAIVDSQQFLTVFHLMNSNSGAAAGEAGSSLTLLDAFRLNMQNHILPRISNAYSITAYVMSEIRDAVLGPIRPPSLVNSIVTRYDNTKREVIIGAEADKGTQVIVNRLPAHEVVRVFKKPSNLARGYFQGNYHRLGPWGEPDHSDTEPEKWAPTMIDPLNIAFESFRVAPLLDGGAAPDNSWTPCIWSAAYAARTLPVVPDDPLPAPRARMGARPIVQYVCDPFVGTQITRRFQPKGLISGK